MANSLLQEALPKTRKIGRLFNDSRESRDPETDVAAALRHPSQTPTPPANDRPRVQLETALRAASLKAAQQRQQANQIVDQIKTRITGGVHELSVSCEENCHFVLRGWCTSYHVKQLAQHLAMNLVGMSHVVNLLEVRRSR